MIQLSLSELCNELNADLIGDDCAISAISTDSRDIPESGLFIALKGDRFDAHDFIDDTVCEKATAIMVSKRLNVNVPQLVVADTRIALGLLAGYVRKKVNIKAVAITGSNGKTSVKEMVANILLQQYSVLFTAGNFNNDIGLPLTLLRLEQHHQIGVFELGANHKGEIDYTSQLVNPDVALVNNIGDAHIEGFGSIEAVAEAKSEIYHHLKTNGTAIINLDDKFAPFLLQKTAQHQVLTFGVSQAADIYATEISCNSVGEYKFTLNTKNDEINIQLALSGRHQVINALAAAAISIALRVNLNNIKSGLESVMPVSGRMQPHDCGRLLLVDDSYNANPSSVKAAMEWLTDRDGIKVIVLGDLAEMGANSKNMLTELGQYAQQLNITNVLTVGQDIAALSAACEGEHFYQIDDLVDHIKTKIFTQQESINLLVKGSRSAATERVVDALLTANLCGELI